MAFPTGWSTSYTLAINPDYIDSTLTDFAVLLTEENLPDAIFDNAQDGGGDLRASSDSDGSTRLSIQVVSFNTTARTAQVWVKIPSISSSEYTLFRIWCNTVGIDTQPAADAAYGSESVWNSDYKGVWHCEESPSGSAPQILDSTSNDRHLTSQGSMASGDSVSGVIGNELDFDGVNDALTGSITGITSTNTCELWVTGRSFSAGMNKYLMDMSASGNNNWMQFYDNDSNGTPAVWAGYTATGTSYTSSGTDYSADTVYHVVVSRDAATKTISIYINGTLANSSVVANIATPTALYIGRYGSAGAFFWRGELDEIRISGIVRSAAWIKATYHSINTVDFVGQVITPSGIASSETFGSHSVSLEVNASGITSAEAFGDSIVSLEINTSGIASDETFGTNSATLEVNSTGISSVESFGSHTVSLRVNTSGIASAEAFGDHVVSLEINPSGIVSAEAFGDHEVTAGLFITPDGIASGEAFGDHVVSLEINNTGITSGEAFGDPAIPIKVDCTGITSGESFGTSQINLQAVCTSISSEESFSAQSSLFTDLISLWKLDETSGTRVDSIGDNDLTDNSTVGSATGLINSAASFTSELESLSIDDNASINVSGNINWSYSVWVKLANKTFSYGILNKGTPSTGEWHLEYLSSSDRFRFGVRGSAKTTVSANELGSPVAGVWYHILVWHDADNDEIGIQVNNGTSDVSSHSSGVKIGTDTFHIGRNPGVFNPPLSGGLIDEVKFWKKILTTQEKSDLYNSGSGISLPEQGIVLTLGPEPQTLETTGITSAESFGTSQLNLKIASNSINSSEDFGTSQINLEVSPTSVSSSESFGIANIGSQTVSPSSILSSESFGTSQINLQIVPISISSSESFGTLSVNLELVTSSISSEESFGTTQLNQEITPSGIESSEVFGSHTVELSGTQNVQPSGISSDESFGSATISLKVNCTGITSSESFGIHSLSQHILHTSITSEESFGSHILSDDSNVGYLFKRKILQRKSNIKLNDNRFTSLKLLDDRIGNVKISNLTQIKSKILSRRNKTKLEE